MFIALFPLAKNWKLYKCPLSDEFVNTMLYIHAVKYYTTTKDGLLMYLQQVILKSLSESCQVQNKNVCFYLIYFISSISSFQKRKNNRSVIALGCKQELSVNGLKEIFLGGGNILKLNNNDGCTTS